MSFFGNDQPRDDNTEPFLNALVSYTSDDGATYLGAGVLRNSDVYTAIRVIAGDLAGNPITYNDQHMTKLLNRSPNDHMTGYSFKFTLAANMLLNGNSFARIVRNNSGQVSSLEFLPNSQVTVVQDDDSSLLYVIKPAGTKNEERLKASDVLHFKMFTRDGYTGISPLYSLRDELKIQHSGKKMFRSYLQNGVLGTGVLKVHKADLDKKAKANIRQKFEEANSGENALRTLIIDEGMDYSNLQVNSDVLKFVNQNDLSTAQIAKAFGLPPEKLGLESTHSNAEQTNLLYLQNTLVQYFACWTSELDAKLATGTNSFGFNTDALFTADPATMQSLAKDGVINSLRTINEARTMLGLPAVDGGDVLMASLNYEPFNRWLQPPAPTEKE